MFGGINGDGLSHSFEISLDEYGNLGFICPDCNFPLYITRIKTNRRFGMGPNSFEKYTEIRSCCPQCKKSFHCEICWELSTKTRIEALIDKIIRSRETYFSKLDSSRKKRGGYGARNSKLPLLGQPQYAFELGGGQKE